MSLVGPRPERPEFVAQLSEQIPYYDVRHFSCPASPVGRRLNLVMAHPLPMPAENWSSISTTSCTPPWFLISS